jgi:hypothetical protein
VQLTSTDALAPPFRPETSFGTARATTLACRRIKRRQQPGRQTMTFNINTQQLLASVLGAVIASTLFISAAVGPVSQFI